MSPRPIVRCPEALDPLRPLSPRAREIVRCARGLLERDGWAEVSMRTLAGELGIRAPSLYKHLAGRDALRSALTGIGLAETGEVLHTVVARGGGIPELLAAYRKQAHANPNLYRLATTGELDRASLPAGLEDWSGAPFGMVMDGDPYGAQALWSLAHGMTVLELDGRYPTGRAPSRTWAAAAGLFG